MFNKHGYQTNNYVFSKSFQYSLSHIRPLKNIQTHYSNY